MLDLRNSLHASLTALMAWIALRLDVSDTVFAHNSSFDYMAGFASQRIWSIMFLAVANIGVIGLLVRQPAVRLASVLVVATAHGVLAGCLLVSNGGIWSGTYAIIATLGYILAYDCAKSGI